VRPRDGGDDAIVVAAKAGEPEAWRTLYERVGGRLVGWIRAQSVIDAAIDAEDVANEAWLTAARKVADFNGSADDFAGWLFGIARNLIVNANRRSLRRRTSPTELDPYELAGQHVADVADGTASSDHVRRMLSCLTHRERDVVACIDVAGLDTATTSKVLGISRSAVRVAHHRAIRRLQSRHRVDRSADTAGHGTHTTDQQSH